MKTGSKTTYLQSAVRTIGFYLSYVGCAFGLERMAPSGPCTPGGGVVLLIFLFPVSILLLIKNIIRIQSEKSKVVSAIIHFCVIIFFYASVGSNFF